MRRENALLEDVSKRHSGMREFVYEDGLVFPLDIVQDSQSENGSNENTN
jgi:hypothetical protein